MTGDRSVNIDEAVLSSPGPQHTRLVQASSSVSEDDASALTNDVALTSPNTNTTNKSPDAASCVQVAVRVRPLLSSLESGCGQCIHIQPSLLDYPTAIQVGPRSGPTFTFDEVFPTTTTQVLVFEHKVAPLVERCMEGYNATILAYGQTGSGKTHTVIGPSSCHSTAENESSGMIPRAVSALFQQLQAKKIEMDNQQQLASSPQKSPKQQQQQQLSKSPASSSSPRRKGSPTKSSLSKDDQSFQFQVRVQFLELYGEEIRDLLVTSSSTSSAGEKLTIRDIGNDEPEVVGATSQVVASAEEALRCLTKGMLRRVTAATAMNESSSRSHAIFSILMEQTWTEVTTLDDAAAGPQVRRSKFNFVDLAGSERQKRTRAEGRRLKEGIDINKGLLVLGNVISALGDPKKRGKAFVPYRDSKLTRLLKGSLGGNHKTLMIACVSPSSTNMEESLNCLRYANRAKNIQNRAVVNMDARSRMITELKTQVQALAKDLLRAKETGDPGGGAFTREALVTLASGGSADQTAVKTAMSPTKKQSAAVTPAITRTMSMSSTASFLSPALAGVSNDAMQQRLNDAECELERTTHNLKRHQRESLIKEERLHVTQAEKEFYRLQLEAISGGEAPDGAPSAPLKMDEAFVKRASEYEKEIGQLKDELRAFRGQVNHKTQSFEETGSQGFSIAKASQNMLSEKERLANLQTELLALSPQASPSKTKSPEMKIFVDRQSSGEDVDSEAKAEEEHLTALTLKYSHMEDEDEVMIVDKQNSPRVSTNADMGEAEKSSQHRRAQIEADLLEISRVIESKEELISQLQSSQAKYSSMKEFYEGKLHEMEKLLDQKEGERQKIIVELEKLKDNNDDTRDLEAQLKKKEEHIAGIRKQKLQLKDLTAVSSKNAAEISKLQYEVKAMKERKVSMHKQLTEERKAHAAEVKMLKKNLLQKDRETRKWQKISNQKTSEAEKASNVAKMKGHQLGQLRTKYKDAEKTIRMLQIKKGVMAKAGLDSVIVGRRVVDKKKNQSRNPSSEGRSVDADALREYFDQKVAEVSRKEALADKLARGWEEHMQLSLQRAELAEQDSKASKDEIQGIDLRIQYEEDRIRKLAHRLGKKQPAESGGDKDKLNQPNSILYGKDFQKLCKGVAPARSSEIAAKVLFGMIVRERRRIASLAKTASALDEKLQECQMDNEAKEVAFRSYVQDSQQDFANISMNHQEQILSLMSLVKGGGDNDTETSTSTDTKINSQDSESATEPTESSKLLVLANERVSVLEQQLRELKAEKKVSESYRLEKEDLKSELESKTDEYEKLEVRLAGLRGTLRQIRDQLMDAKRDETDPTSDEPDSYNNCLDIIRKALLDSPGPLSPMARRHSCPNVFHPSNFSPQSQKQWEFMQGAAAEDDEEAEEETPDWADEIMADLALIAEGQLPPSLKDIPEIARIDNERKDEKKSPERVKSPARSSPPRKTGIPKPRITASSSPKNRPSPDNQTLSPSRAEGDLGNSGDSMPPENLDSRLSKLVTPGKESKTTAKHPKQPPSDEVLPSSSLKSDTSATSSKGAKEADISVSVFDRLVNPTNFTGIQKGKHHAAEKTKEEHLDSAADRMLDQLLESNADLFGTRMKDEPSGKRSSDASAKGEAASKVHEYTQQDVFERLQKTTTQSFAVKHATTHEAPESNGDGHSSEASLGHKPEIPKPRPSIEGKTKKGIPPTGTADHLTTEPDATTFNKVHKSPSRTKIKPKINTNVNRTRSLTKPTDSNSRSTSPSRQRKEQYTQQNVFDRLTKTTTEAYAVKKKKLGGKE